MSLILLGVGLLVEVLVVELVKCENIDDDSS